MKNQSLTKLVEENIKVFDDLIDRVNESKTVKNNKFTVAVFIAVCVFVLVCTVIFIVGVIGIHI